MNNSMVRADGFVFVRGTEIKELTVKVFSPDQTEE